MLDHAGRGQFLKQSDDIGSDGMRVGIVFRRQRVGDFGDGAIAIAQEQHIGRLGIRRGPVLYLGTGPRARILIGAQTEEDIGAAIDEYEPSHS